MVGDVGGGECGGDGGGVGQGRTGEGWSRSGARGAGDSSVSSECHSGGVSAVGGEPGDEVFH